jgi:subtilase family serine protease
MKPLNQLVAAASLLAVAAVPAFAQTGNSHMQTTQTKVTTLTRATTLGAQDKVMGPLAARKSLHIVVALKLRNQNKLRSFLRQTRSGANHVQPLSTHEFVARYSPTSTQAAKVAKFLKAAGFSNVEVTSNRMFVSGDAPASTVEKTFQTQLVSVATRDGRIARANKSAPKIPASLQSTVLSVLGLQTVHRVHTMHVVANGVQAHAQTGHNPTEFASIYGAGNAPTASGVTVGIITEGSLTNVLSDLNSFTSQNGLPSVNTQVVNTGGSSGDTSGDGEWDLDSQDIVGMAGGVVGKLIFYNMPSMSFSSLTTAFNRVVQDNDTKIVNVSLGACETAVQNNGAAAAEDQIFQEAKSQGQTFSVSSGDSGADECGDGSNDPSWPAASQYVVSVGGTTLSTSGSSWSGETVWSDTGGSPSSFEPMPGWQQGVGQNAGHSARGVADIAFDADPNTGALVIVDGRQQQIGGTSLAAPLFSGLWARVIAAHGTDVGFAAPLIYGLSSSVFHDVTQGNNGGYSATSGWDYPTGFGSMKIADVVNAIGGGGGNPPPGGGNNPPHAQNGSITTNENQAKSGTLAASDPDGDSLTFSIVGQPSHGSVQITNTSSGDFTYTPDSDYSGSDSFTFKANDGEADSNTATESVTVKASSSGSCPAGFLHFTGSVSQGHDSYQPNNTYFYGGYGTEKGRLSAASGTDFDLYLYKYSGFFGWTLVAYSTHYGSSESIDYNGTPGNYMWDIYAYSGSGSYDFCMQRP